MLNKFFNYFTVNEKSSYSIAKEKLSKIKENISDVLVVLPDDLTVVEMLFVKDKWETLSSKIAYNVSTMGIDLNRNYKSVLTKLVDNSEIYPHEHLRNIETIYVCYGEIEVLLDGVRRILRKGDKVTIGVGSTHSIKSNSEAILFTKYANNKKYLELTDLDVKFLSELS